jgi:hypothetical protein
MMKAPTNNPNPAPNPATPNAAKVSRNVKPFN